MKKITKLILLFVITISFHSCEKTDFGDGLVIGEIPDVNLADQIFQSENFGNATTGNFVGTVTDKFGMNLQGVQITIGNLTTMTDRNGIFVMNNADVFENFAYVKAQKVGYMNGSRVVIPKADGVNKISIVLLKKEITATVNSGEASEVATSGAKVRFTGDFVTASGDSYDGPVDVVLNYLSPNPITTFNEMPGSLFAQTTSNDARGLETYGMLSVNLFSPSGQPLNIDENNPAIIEMRALSSHPDTIKLWYFDEEVGYWKEDGEAVKVGNKYIGEVTHFTWWNCDVPFDFVNLCFSLSPTANDVTTVYRTYIQRVSTNQVIFSGLVFSGEELECGLIPRNEEVKVYVYGTSGSCSNQLVYEEVIGGYATDTTVDFSFDVQASTTTFTGTVTNCDGNPLTNGYVYIDHVNTFSITDGIIDFGLQHCFPENIVVQIFDADASQWNIVDITLNGGEIDLGMLSTCDDTGGIYNGDITLSTQADVNDFGAFGYTIINGSLRIGGEYMNPSNITDLTPLLALEEVNSLNIRYNENLLNLEGLNNITKVNSLLYIESNDVLQSISNLSNLENVWTIRISNNNALTSLEGLGNITSTNLTIRNNSSLTSLAGLESITTLGTLNLRYNQSLTSISQLINLTSLNTADITGQPLLTSLEGLNQITSLQFLRVTNNDSLEDLSELSNLTSINWISIGGNDSLINLNGLENVLFNRWMLIGKDFETDIVVDSPNTSLVDLCALQNLFVNGDYIATSTSIFNGVTIVNNAFNPSVQDIINGNCN